MGCPILRRLAIQPFFAAKEPASTSQVTPQVSGQVAALLGVVSEHQEYSKVELMEKVSLKHRDTFSDNYLKPAIESGWIEMIILDKPTGRLQKYRLMKKGESHLK